jgi:hypothetical protein
MNFKRYYDKFGLGSDLKIHYKKVSGTLRVLKWFYNLFFMKLTMLNVCLSSIELKTWIVTILTNFMYPKSLSLRMGDEETLCQRFLIGFRSFFSCKTILELCNMFIFEKLNYSISVWPKNKTRAICLDSPTFQHTKSDLQHTQ